MPSPTKEQSVKTSKRKKCSIEDVYENSVDKMAANPLLVTFRTAQPQEGDPEARLGKEEFSDGNRLGHKYMSQLTITGYGNKKYVGYNLRSKNSVQDETVLLGILDKATGKMKLVEVEHFMVAPELGNITSTAMAVTLDPNKRLDAVTAFGTKKAIKSHKALMLERERQTSDAVGTMISASENIVESSRIPDIQNDTSSNSMLPAINENAAVVKEIYSMSSVVDDEVLETFIDEARDLLETNIPESDKLSTLFLSSLAVTKLELDDETKLRHACACIYMEHLRRIVTRLPLALETMDTVLVSHFKKEFPMTKRNIVSDTGRDKALARLLVLALLINHNRIQLSAIANSVTVPKAKLVKFTTALRMKQTSNDIRLSLPLPPPLSTEFTKVELTKRKK